MNPDFSFLSPFLEREELAVNVSSVLRTRKVTAVTIDVVLYNPKTVEPGVKYLGSFVGTAVKNDMDKYDYEAGMFLALSRALKKAAKNLDSMHNERVHRGVILAERKKRVREERKESLIQDITLPPSENDIPRLKRRNRKAV